MPKPLHPTAGEAAVRARLLPHLRGIWDFGLGLNCSSGFGTFAYTVCKAASAAVEARRHGRPKLLFFSITLGLELSDTCPNHYIQLQVRPQYAHVFCLIFAPKIKFHDGQSPTGPYDSPGEGGVFYERGTHVGCTVTCSWSDRCRTNMWSKSVKFGA